MKTKSNMLQTRKMSVQRQKRHNITIDGGEQITPSKNKIDSLLIGPSNSRVPRSDSIQNLILTCKNASKKHVHFNDLLTEEQPRREISIEIRPTDCNLFSLIRNSKQNCPTISNLDFKLPQSSNQRESSKSSKQLLHNGNI
jgi:hypothetical protein